MSIDGSDLTDQKHRLTKEYGFTPSQARELQESTRKYICIQADTENVFLSKETVDTLTNVVIAIGINLDTETRKDAVDTITVRFVSLMCLGFLTYTIAKGLMEGANFMLLSLLGILFLIALRANIRFYA